MARPIAEHTLDGPTGRFDRQTGIVRFEPAARRQFSATDDLKAQIAAMKRQIQAATRRAEVAETQLARLKQSGQMAAPVVSPATTVAAALAIIGAKVYAQRRQMSAPERPTIDPDEIYRQRRPPAGGSPAALYIRRRTQVETTEEVEEEPPQASFPSC